MVESVEGNHKDVSRETSPPPATNMIPTPHWILENNPVQSSDLSYFK